MAAAPADAAPEAAETAAPVAAPRVVATAAPTAEEDVAEDPAEDATPDPAAASPWRVAAVAARATVAALARLGGRDPTVAGEDRLVGAERGAVVALLGASRGLGCLALRLHPRNRIGHVDVLAEHGIVVYRGKRRRAEPLPASPSERAWERVRDRTTGSERTAIRPIRDDSGIWNLPATIMFDVDARPRLWRLWIRQVERRLAQAVARGSLFHLWFHPHNLRDHPEQSFEALDRICVAMAQHRTEGTLDTLTMGALADQLNATSPTG